jgi:RNA polymerase sigma-70 factor, ECF subfamily
LEDGLTEDVPQLVERAQQRDAAAFEVLIGRYERSALAVAHGLLSNADRAGDAVQDAFLRAWQELKSLKDPRRFGGWLMQIVRHAAIDLRRRTRSSVEYPDWVPADDAVDPVAISEAAEATGRVQEALETLDETTRAAVMLRYYEGLATKEIAELLEMTPAAVDMRISRGRGQLKEQLADLVEAPAARERRIGER